MIERNYVDCTYSNEHLNEIQSEIKKAFAEHNLNRNKILKDRGIE